MNKLKLILSIITSFSCFHQVEASSKKKCLVENIGYDLANLNPHRVNDFSKMRVFDDLFDVADLLVEHERERFGGEAGVVFEKFQ